MFVFVVLCITKTCILRVKKKTNENMILLYMLHGGSSFHAMDIFRIMKKDTHMVMKIATPHVGWVLGPWVFIIYDTCYLHLSFLLSLPPFPFLYLNYLLYHFSLKRYTLRKNLLFLPPFPFLYLNYSLYHFSLKRYAPWKNLLFKIQKYLFIVTYTYMLF